MKRIIIFAFLLLAITQLAHAQAGYLDETFGMGGIEITDTYDEGFGYESVLLPDGKILQTARVGKTYSLKAVIYRREHNGKIDSSFGQKGSMSFRFEAHMFDPQLATYPDGRILFAGDKFYCGCPEYISYLYRLLPSGKIDSTFGTNGRQYISDSTLSQMHYLSLTTDDKILAVGEEGSYFNTTMMTKPVLWRLTPNGKRDSTFGTNGKIPIPLARDSMIVLTSCKDSNDRYVVFYRRVFEGKNEILMLRTYGDGTLDTMFGSGGELKLVLTDSQCDIPMAMTLPEGSIVFAINFGVSPKLRTALVKVTKESELDQTFGGSGSVEIETGADYTKSKALALDSSGRIVVAGLLSKDSGTSSSVFRILPGGVIDSSFGLNGALHLIEDYSGYAFGVLIQPDGKYLITGGSQSNQSEKYRIMMARLNPEPKSSVLRDIPTSSPISLHPTPSTDNCTVTYTLPTSGNCTMTLRDESGREVRSFARDEYRTSGEHEEELDLRGLAAGVYFLQIESGGAVQSAKLIKQ